MSAGSMAGNRDVTERRRDHPLRADQVGPLEGVGVEVARPQHRPCQTRLLDGVFQMRGVAFRAHAMGGQQDDAPDAGRPHDVEDVTQIAVRHEVGGGQQEQRFGTFEGGLEALRLGQVGLR